VSFIAHAGREKDVVADADGSAESMVLVTDGTPNPLLRSLEGMYPASSRVSA